MNRQNQRGQNLAEFVVVAAALIAVFTGMKLYLQRSLQARYRDGVQHFFSEIRKERPGTPAQYETEYYTNSRIRRRGGEKVPGREGSPNLVTRSSEGMEYDEMDQVYSDADGESWQESYE